MAIIPQIRHALPEAKLPFQRPSVLVAMLGSATVVKVLRSSPSVRPAAQELVGGLLSLAPAVLALRGSEVAAYHGAEHISIGSYEQGKRATKEHNRCGSHLLGPLLVTTAIGNTLASRFPAHAPWACTSRSAAVRRGSLHRDLRLDGAESREAPRTSAREAGSRAPAQIRDRGAVT